MIGESVAVESKMNSLKIKENKIDPRAVIDPRAKISENVTIGPFSIVGPNVEIGAGTWIGPHVYIKGRTRIGRDNKIFQFASVGEDPQDVKYHGEDTVLEMGDRNIIREYCTFNRGTAQGGGITKIGNDNLFLAYVHVAHDCQIGHHTIFSNNASLAGHVTVSDYVVLGGFSAVYQFSRLGQHCFLSGGSMVAKDVPPFVKAANWNSYAKPFGLNSVGLRRRNFSAETMIWLKRAYRTIYRDGLTLEEAIEKLKIMAEQCSEINILIEFLQHTKHGIIR